MSHKLILLASPLLWLVLAGAPGLHAAQFGFTVSPVVEYTGQSEVRDGVLGDTEGTGLPYSFFLRSGPFHFSFMHYEITAEADTTATSPAGLTRQTVMFAENDVFALSYAVDFIGERDFLFYGLAGLALVQSRFQSSTFQDDPDTPTLIDVEFFDTRHAVSENIGSGLLLALGATWTLEQSTLFGVELRGIAAESTVKGTVEAGGQLATRSEKLDVSALLLSIVVGVGF